MTNWPCIQNWNGFDKGMIGISHVPLVYIHQFFSKYPAGTERASERHIWPFERHLGDSRERLYIISWQHQFQPLPTIQPHKHKGNGDKLIHSPEASFKPTRPAPTILGSMEKTDLAALGTVYLNIPFLIDCHFRISDDSRTSWTIYQLTTSHIVRPTPIWMIFWNFSKRPLNPPY